MSFLNKGNGAQDYNPNGDTMITDRAPEDGISDLAWSPAAFNFLAVASWDSKLRVYDVNNNLSCQGMQDQGAPILSCTWSQVRVGQEETTPLSRILIPQSIRSVTLRDIEVPFPHRFSAIPFLFHIITGRR